MTFTFPLAPTPAQYGPCVWNQPGSKRNGVFYQGDTVTVTLAQAGATGYVVRNGYHGTVVSSGALSSSATVCTPTPPTGGWKLGPYRIYFTGPINDTLFGTTYSVTNFQVVSVNPHFLPMPAGNVVSADAGFGEGADLIAKGVLGIGTSRAVIGNAQAATLSTANFTQPAVNATVTVQVVDTAWMLATSMSGTPYIYIAGAGAYLVSSITDGTHVVLTNPGYAGLNVAPGTVIGSGAHVSDRDLWVCEAMAATGQTYWLNPGAQYLDTARPRYMWSTFPNGAFDVLSLPDTGSGVYLNAYVKTGALDGSQVFVKVDPGSASGNKVTVRYPNSTTIVETYDNQLSATAAQAAINAASAYVQVFAESASLGATHAATAIGNKTFAGVTLIVSILYAAGITRFEGPVNEPPMNAETAQQMRVFQAAVHAGNASAKAIGPCPVSIDAASADGFFAAGGGAYCDEISAHAYNSQTSGDINVGRHQLSSYKAMLASHGLSAKPLWQTESTQAMVSVFGVHHPRRSRLALMAILQMEQYGIPRERNNQWYDVTHGFWSVPVQWQNADGSLNPQCVMLRTLTSQTWGKTHNQILDFGTPGNNIFLGSVYVGAAGKTAMVMTTSALPGATVTFQTSAAGPLTVSDAFENTSTVNVSDGRFTVAVEEIPTYIALPAGATISVVTVNGWPSIGAAGQGANSSVLAAAKVGSTSTSIINSGVLKTSYPDSTHVYFSSATPPEPATLRWATATRLDRVVVVGGSFWQLESAPITFTVDTSVDGTTWVTQETVDVSADCVAFLSGSDLTNIGCQYETFCNEQWIFDVPFTAPVTCKAVRVSVSATSQGGEPLGVDPAIMGQGDYQHVVLQQIFCFCDNNTIPHYGAHL